MAAKALRLLHRRAEQTGDQPDRLLVQVVKRIRPVRPERDDRGHPVVSRQRDDHCRANPEKLRHLQVGSRIVEAVVTPEDLTAGVGTPDQPGIRGDAQAQVLGSTAGGRAEDQPVALGHEHADRSRPGEPLQPLGHRAHHAAEIGTRRRDRLLGLDDRREPFRLPRQCPLPPSRAGHIAGRRDDPVRHRSDPNREPALERREERLELDLGSLGHGPEGLRLKAGSCQRRDRIPHIPAEQVYRLPPDPLEMLPRAGIEQREPPVVVAGEVEVADLVEELVGLEGGRFEEQDEEPVGRRIDPHLDLSAARVPNDRDDGHPLIRRPAEGPAEWRGRELRGLLPDDGPVERGRLRSQHPFEENLCSSIDVGEAAVVIQPEQALADAVERVDRAGRIEQLA